MTIVLCKPSPIFHFAFFRLALVTFATLLATAAALSAEQSWIPFDPKPDQFESASAIDLRFMNERFAGEHGFISITNGQFIHSANGGPLTFWGVNGPPHELTGDALKSARECSRSTGSIWFASMADISMNAERLT